MFQPLSKEALAALVSGDAGFQEYLSVLPESERSILNSLLESPDILNTLLASLPSDQRSATSSILDTIHDIPDRAFDLYNQCRFFEARELLKKTIDLYELPGGMQQDAIVKAADFVVQRVKALCYVMLGDVEQALGNSRIAGEHHLQALRFAEECGDHDTEAKALQGLGCYFWEIGDFEQAMEHSRLAIETLGDGADRWSTKAKALNSLSLIHGQLSQWDDAWGYGEQAIALAEERHDIKTLPVLLCNMASRLTDLHCFDEIWPLLERALEIAVDQGAMRQEVFIRHNIGMNHLNCAEHGEDVTAAIDQFREAMSISRRISDVGLEALACSGMGHALIMAEDADGAAKEYRRAVDLYRSNGASADCAETLVNLGDTLRYCRNDLKGALECYCEAIDLTEQIRSKLKRESHRIGLSEARTEPYQQAITALLELGRADEAFHYLERARSKALLELMAGQFSPDSGDEAFRKTTELARRIDELRHTLDEIQKAAETGSGEEQGETTSRAAMRSEIQQGLEKEERQFSKLCEELQRIAPEQYGLVAVQASDSIKVQAILPTNTALLELYQTAEQLLLFVIRAGQATKVITVELTVDDASEMVFSFIMALRDPSTLDTRSHDYLRMVRQPSIQLHEIVFGPLAELLDGVQRLVIVPHLFWHYLPFHVLYDGKSKQHLLDHFEISYAPSASALVVCRDKQRLKRDSALILCRNDGDLPHVETEGVAISKVFNHSSLFNGSEAVLSKISRQDKPDVIHCACHGYFDPEQPFLSGIAIPPDLDEDRPTLLIDLLRLRLESSLVTLSACDTGLNRISNADELVGLSRGFLGAGAAALLLSLWKVADSSTAYLMENFYWHYVANRQTKGRAIQLAMQAVRTKPEYAHPYYWAPFVLMGEWE
jgi:CHAT domain-containing protein/tetratricopeptide (TPR) repeat protein